MNPQKKPKECICGWELGSSKCRDCHSKDGEMAGIKPKEKPASGADLEGTWKPCTKKPIQVEYREVQGEKELIETREGILFAYAGKDYIIRGVKGEIYPISKEIFEQTYEAHSRRKRLKKVKA